MDYEERQALRMRRVSVPIHMPIGLAEVIDRLSDRDSVSASHTAIRLLRKGIEAERAEHIARNGNGA